MGIPCSKKKYQKNTKSRTNDGTPVESDEVLNFKVEISNIKARNLPNGASYVKVKFGSRPTSQTPPATNASQNYSWRFQEEFDYKTTGKNLQEDVILLTLMSDQDKEIGVVSINLYDIATGPAHQDFVMKMKKGQGNPGRLCIDVKMSQIINIMIKSKSIHCKMNGTLREKFYNFSLKMTSKEREFGSEHSENFKNMQMFSSIAEKLPEEIIGDENHQMYMDENGKVKTKYFAHPRTNRNFQKMRLDPQEENDAETLETSKHEDDDSLMRISKKLVPPKLKPTISTLTHVPPAKKDITWVFPEGKNRAPFLEMSVNLRELSNGSFQLFLWANKQALNKSISEDDGSDYSGDELYIDHKLVAECFIGMHMFFVGDAETHSGEVGSKVVGPDATTTGKSYQQREVRIQEKLLYHGEHEGDLIAEFIVQNSSFYKQMIFGVRTEEGIQRSSSLYLNANNTYGHSFKNSNVKEIKTLSQHKEALKNITFNLYGPKVNPRTRIRLIDEQATNILKVLDILKTSHRDSVISVLYKTPENLLASQKTLIGLAKHALENCDEVSNSLRPIYFETLLMLIHRAEFELNYMGFDESYEEFLKNAQKTSFKNDIGGAKFDLKNIQQKLKVCESYQSFLYLALQKVLMKLNQRGLPDKEREFVEQFTAIAYFRIPEFRKKLLECLKKDIEHTHFPEWKSKEWRLDDRFEANAKNQHFMSLFDWEGDFYVYLKNTEKGENNYKLLNQILEDKDWQNRLSKRGLAFHSFLNEWAKHVNKTVVTKDHVPWQDLPGYSILIKSFLVELKSKDVKRYSQPLLNASYSLLKNEKLLNTFIAVAYNKTRLYESSNVFSVFELINHWFAVLRENKKSISPLFDYAYFFKGIIMVIEGDHALNIAKVLWVIYNNFNLFPYNQKEHLSEYFFGDVFFKLFLHWSWNVRNVFHHLLIYRFYHQHRNTTTNLTNLDDLKKELLLYNQRRETLSKTKNVLINDFINMQYSHHMTIIENAYKKYREGKRQRNPRNKAQANPRALTTRTAQDTIRGNVLPTEFDDNRHSPVLQGLDSEKKEEFFPKLKLKVATSEKQEVDSVVDDFFEVNEKFSSKQNIPQIAESSYWLINPDNLELSIQGPNARMSMSESLNMTPTERMRNRPEELNMLEIEAAKRATEVLDTMRYSQPNEARKSIHAIAEEEKKSKDKDKEKDKKKVIMRRLMYFDKQTNKLKEIPKEYAVYLEYAYKEYEAIKEQYVRWFIDTQQTMAKMPEEQAKKLKADPKVPEVPVKIPLDDGEDGQDLDDW